MKTITNIFAVLVLTVGISFFSSCDKVESLTDVKFDANMDADIGVVIPADNNKSVLTEGYEFSESATIDPRENSDIDKYFDKLKGFDVQEVTGTVKKVVGGPVVITQGKVTISSDKESVSWDIPQLILEEGKSVTFGNDNGEWDKVNKILDEKKKFNVTLSGVSDKNGISFTFTIEIKAKVTANPLS